MGPSHGGMQRSLEMMKRMVRTGEGPERDAVEQHLPSIALAVVGAAILVVLVVRFLAWLS